ncbi:LPXTG-motif cell wall anchor domain-containing protein/TQXA domain-containing protein [Peptoniphilus asaccharolyticus DSM 20463]|uniref:LPXTG-motif cell wall anchor domain-containing protein/TQXA domain-containing protein n=1 Tax=Peptoniphilus asaccharolyticus DSM 20463 TaxID=573058 RepID=A0A1W1VI39_PEPAS|nr:SpaA isopeptide-forming pilin-related protein [Peptoniphilus asaccharolyticus]SMB92943.1 LPXTG-motif cell wall anchor domain-containing protein/TQXA domain-containing protein [Peptoniphilus asaccharolyticus DSM 20463]
MEKGKRLLSFMLAIIMMLGILPSNLIKVNATGENDYGVVGAYKAYSYNEKLYENPGDTDGAANEVIYIKKNNDNDRSTKGMPAYCFNASLSMVDVYGKLDDVPDFSNLTDPMPTYTKINGSVGTTFVDLAAAERIQDNNELTKAVLKVIYNGYRENDGNRVEEIKNAYKKKYNEDISDAEVYAATQKAIWYYTDSVKEFELGDKRIGKQITTKVLRVYRFLIGKDDHGLGLDLKDYTGGKTLDLYMPDRGPKDTGLAYQNLLGTEIVDKNETTVKKHDITVKKVDEDGKSKLAGATLQLKSEDNIIYKWKTDTEDNNQFSNPRKFHLQAGKYELSEIAAPEGYKKADPITFTVDGQGKVNGKTEIVMTNTKIPVMSVDVSKTWNDENDGPISENDKEFLTVKVKLKADGQDAKDASGNEVTPILLKKGAWNGEFKNLPIYHPGKENQPNEKINYTVEELDIPAEFKRVAGQNDTVTGDNNGDTKSIALVNKKTKTPDKPEVKSEARVNRIQVNKKWSSQDKKSNKEVYFELWKEVEGKQSKVTKDDFPEGMGNIDNPQKLGNGQSVTWRNLFVKEEFQNKNFKFLVKEVDSKGNAWEDEENGYPANDTVYDGAVQPNGMAKLFEVTNTYKEPTPKPEAKEIIISKTKLGGVEVEGAEIEIYKADGQTIATDKITGQAAKWTSEKAEKHLKLEVGEYIFKEVAAPEGLQKITELKFKVKADGKVEVLSKGTNEDKTEATVQVNGNKLTVEDKAKEVKPEVKEIIISKTKLGGEEVEGAEIEIYKADGQTIATDKITGKDAKWTSEKAEKHLKLEVGEYIFKEVAAPEGLQKITELKFKVKADGKVEVLSKGTNEDKTEATVQVNGNKLTVEDKAKEVKPEVKEIIISKTKLGGEEVEGAEIEIYKADGQTIATDKITGQAAKWKSEKAEKHLKLEVGEYIFKEVAAPEGLQKITELKFKVKADGKVEVLSKGTNEDKTEATVQVNGNKLTVEDKAKEVKPEVKEIIISKTKLGGEEVEGAEIEIYKADGQTIATDKITGQAAKWKSEKAEKHLKLEVGEYIFKEVAAPEGLQKITELKFEVKADGKVEVLSKGTNEDKTEATVQVNGNKLTVEDKAKEEDNPVVPGPGPKEETATVKFSKQDIEGRELAGARIVLAGDNGYRNEWTSNGSTEEFTLKEGRYTFREISTPDNSKYEFATEITFEVVKDNGKLKIQNVIVGTGNRELADGTLVMVDDYKRNDNPYVPVYPRPSEPNRDAEVRFSKQNLAGKELAGAQIELIRDGRVIDSWKTTGVDRTFNLSEGTYVFRETIAPEGYKISTDITFTVTRNGEIINVGATGKNYVAGSLVVMVDDYKDSEIPTEPTKPNTEDPTKPTEPTKPNTEDPKKEDKPIIEDAKQEKDGDNSDDNGVVADNNDNGFDDNYNNAKHLPKTGDGVNPIVYAGAMVLAGAALGILGFRKLRISRK